MLDRLIRLGDVDPEEALLDLAQLGLAEPEPLHVSTTRPRASCERCTITAPSAQSVWPTASSAKSPVAPWRQSSRRIRISSTCVTPRASLSRSFPTPVVGDGLRRSDRRARIGAQKPFGDWISRRSSLATRERASGDRDGVDLTTPWFCHGRLSADDERGVRRVSTAATGAPTESTSIRSSTAYVGVSAPASVSAPGFCNLHVPHSAVE